MRIGTYNVLGLTGFPKENARAQLSDVERTVEHFAAVFASLECDVLALQEGPPHPVARRLADRMERHLAAFPSPTAFPGYILSRYPVLESRTFSHSGPGGKEGPFSRHAGAALLDVEGERLWVVDVHLHPSIFDLRVREAQVLAGHLDRLLADQPRAIVLGDFNCEVTEAVHGMLQERGFANAILQSGGTITATMDTAGVKPHYIDHIYTSRPLAGAVRAAQVVRAAGFRFDEPLPDGAWAHSDHLPVVAELDWP